eukprot:9740928-Alexandrium_andersonii.AAC.1
MSASLVGSEMCIRDSIRYVGRPFFSSSPPGGAGGRGGHAARMTQSCSTRRPPVSPVDELT